MKKNLTTTLKSILILGLFAFSLHALAVWNPPTALPPNGNTPIPLNVSTDLQTKAGGLVLGGLLVNGFADIVNNLSVAGSVGVGVLNPTAKLDVAGKIKMVDGTQALNKVLASDAVGLASWKTLAELGGGGSGGGNVSNNNINGTANYVTKWINGNNIGNSQIFDNGTNVGIGMFAPTAKLEVNGQVKITGGNPGMNKILASDQTGLASWKTPTEIGIEGGGGGGGGDNFSASWVLRGCTHNLATYSDNPHMHPNGYFFIVPLSMNGWKLAHYSAGVCDTAGGSGNVTITPYIQKANGTTVSLTTLTMQAPNYVAQSNPGTTLNTGDKIRIQNTGTNGTLKGLTFSFRLKP